MVVEGRLLVHASGADRPIGPSVGTGVIGGAVVREFSQFSKSRMIVCSGKTLTASITGVARST